jgi:hypothetical protein
MNISLKNYLNKISISIFIGILMTSAFSVAASNQSQRWTSCYNRSKSRLYFRSHSDRRELKSCQSSTSFRVPKEYHLIETLKEGKGHFSTPIAGTKRTLELDNGRRLLVSQWNNMSKANKILVLEPNLKQGKVKKHCMLDNFGDAYSARFNKDSGKVEVLVNFPRTLGGNDYRQVWKTCSI